MPVRSATLVSGVLTGGGYFALLTGEPTQTYLVKGFACNNKDTAQRHIELWHWGPVGGAASLGIQLGTANLTTNIPYNLTLWLPLNPGFRLGFSTDSPTIHLAVYGAVLYGVASIPPDQYPDRVAPEDVPGLTDLGELVALTSPSARPPRIRRAGRTAPG